VISKTTEQFRKLFAQLPKQIRKQAKESYSQFNKDPFHPGLRFKKVHSTRPIYAVRIAKNYRALGIQTDNKIIWFWIGSHSDYDKLLKQI
jgi:mRNA-degrading endonuclease RelE of RelBE toxin-antitoxin system